MGLQITSAVESVAMRRGARRVGSMIRFANWGVGFSAIYKLQSWGGQRGFVKSMSGSRVAIANFAVPLFRQRVRLYSRIFLGCLR